MGISKTKRNVIVYALVFVLFIVVCRFINAVIYEDREDNEQVYVISAQKLLEMKETLISEGTKSYISEDEWIVAEALNVYYRLKEFEPGTDSLSCEVELELPRTKVPEAIDMYSEYSIYMRRDLPLLFEVLGFKGEPYVVENDENNAVFTCEDSYNEDNSVYISDYSALIYHDIYDYSLAYIEMPVKAVVEYPDQTVELEVNIRVTFE